MKIIFIIILTLLHGDLFFNHVQMKQRQERHIDITSSTGGTMPNTDYPGPCQSCIDSCSEVWDNQDYSTDENDESDQK